MSFFGNCLNLRPKYEINMKNRLYIKSLLVGIYACSPEDSSFTAVFSDMKITECMWKAHDGQQPDMA